MGVQGLADLSRIVAHRQGGQHNQVPRVADQKKSIKNCVQGVTCGCEKRESILNVRSQEGPEFIRCEGKARWGKQDRAENM